MESPNRRTVKVSANFNRKNCPALCISVRLYKNHLSPQLLFGGRLDSEDSRRPLTFGVHPGMDYLLEFLAYGRNVHRQSQQCDGELEAELDNRLIVPFR